MSSDSDTSSSPSSGTAAPTEGHEGSDLSAAELQLPSDGIGLELVKLLAQGQSADFGADIGPDAADAAAYDGHVALALDTDVMSGIDSTLDLLTSSHQLFDVPALDVALDDSLPT